MQNPTIPTDPEAVDGCPSDLEVSAPTPSLSRLLISEPVSFRKFWKSVSDSEKLPHNLFTDTLSLNKLLLPETTPADPTELLACRIFADAIECIDALLGVDSTSVVHRPGTVVTSMIASCATSAATSYSMSSSLTLPKDDSVDGGGSGKRMNAPDLVEGSNLKRQKTSHIDQAVETSVSSSNSSASQSSAVALEARACKLLVSATEQRVASSSFFASQASQTLRDPHDSLTLLRSAPPAADSNTVVEDPSELQNNLGGKML